MSALVKDAPGGAGAEIVSPLLQACHADLPANVTAVAFGAAENTSCAMTLGDGSVVIGQISLPMSGNLEDGGGPHGSSDKLQIATRVFPAHGVAAVAVCALADGFVSAGQDGRVFAFLPVGGASSEWQSRELFHTEGEWIEALATHAKQGLVACAYADTVAILSSDGALISKTKLDHTITGITFDAAGNRVAVSHYNGVSLLQVDGKGKPTSLYWKGAHMALSWSPDDRYVVTGTQDRELHAWDLVTMQDFRMGGYPRKVQSFAWVGGKEILACGGADVVTAWSFAGAGPGRKPPLEIGFVFGGTVTAVASHPTQPYVACGFSAGNVQIGATGKGEALVAQTSNGSPITGLAWSCNGNLLVATDNVGRVSAFVLPETLGIK